MRTYNYTGSAVFLKTKEKCGGFPLVVNNVDILTPEALY